MSIMFCNAHSKRWDSDKSEDCPDCARSGLAVLDATLEIDVCLGGFVIGYADVDAKLAFDEHSTLRNVLIPAKSSKDFIVVKDSKLTNDSETRQPVLAAAESWAADNAYEVDEACGRLFGIEREEPPIRFTVKDFV